MFAGMLEEALIHSNQQGLTEAFLAEEFGWDKPAPPPPGRGQQRETIAWFMDRQVRGSRRYSVDLLWFLLVVCVWGGGVPKPLTLR
jgi:hypothetical protein